MEQQQQQQLNKTPNGKNERRKKNTQGTKYVNKTIKELTTPSHENI